MMPPAFNRAARPLLKRARALFGRSREARYLRREWLRVQRENPNLQPRVHSRLPYAKFLRRAA